MVTETPDLEGGPLMADAVEWVNGQISQATDQTRRQPESGLRNMVER